MKAIVHKKYGSPDFLELKEIDKPAPNNKEVLVRVCATSINDWDAGLIEGKPYFLRFAYGLFKPRSKLQVLGCDVAGVVESVGEHVSLFKPGDHVYGDIHACGFGAFAEYVCVNEAALLHKPSALSFEEAAANPHGATLAWQALFDNGQLKAGCKLLINGAGGGVGPIALQLAKLHGAEVTGVDRAEKFSMLYSLGFDHVIDYKQEDFTCSDKQYDLVLDVKTNHSPFDYARVLKPNGVYVTVGGSMLSFLQTFLFSKWILATQNKYIRILALEANKGLHEMREYFETGKIKPVIDGPYPFNKLPEMIKLFMKGEQIGRIVIRCNEF